MSQPEMFTATFKALLKEAQFTKEMLGAGATQIRNANYASKGVYFQAFTSLSTGLERIGKLCLMLDYYADHDGAFPGSDYLKRQICHNIATIYEKSASIIQTRSISMEFSSNLIDEQAEHLRGEIKEALCLMEDSLRAGMAKPTGGVVPIEAVA